MHAKESETLAVDIIVSSSQSIIQICVPAIRILHILIYYLHIKRPKHSNHILLSFIQPLTNPSTYPPNSSLRKPRIIRTSGPVLRSSTHSWCPHRSCLPRQSHHRLSRRRLRIRRDIARRRLGNSRRIMRCPRQSISARCGSSGITIPRRRAFVYTIESSETAFHAG